MKIEEKMEEKNMNKERDFGVYALLALNAVASMYTACYSSNIKSDVSLMERTAVRIEEKVEYGLNKIDKTTARIPLSFPRPEPSSQLRGAMRCKKLDNQWYEWECKFSSE